LIEAHTPSELEVRSNGMMRRHCGRLGRERTVVKKPRLTVLRSDHTDARLSHICRGLEGLRVNDLKIVEAPRCDGLRPSSEQPLGPTFTGREPRTYFAEEGRDPQRLSAVIRGEIGVSTRHGEPVRLTNDGTAYNLPAKEKICMHAANNRQLLKVFLPEHPNIWTEQTPELHHDRGDTAKMCGTTASAKPPRQRCDINPGTFTEGVKRFDRSGHKDDIRTRVSRFLQVPFAIFWVSIKVFSRRELGRVHEDREHDLPARSNPLTRDPKQAQVPFVQEAHRGHHANFDVPAEPLTPMT